MKPGETRRPPWRRFESDGLAPPLGYLLLALTTLAVLAGVYFRFKGLGFSPFAIDEYYLATSVGNIIEHGVPALEGGGYYTRGIALQYLAAALFQAGLSHEFAFRLITTLFSIAALPAVFLLARRLGGLTAGCLAVSLCSLTVWEIEFARFARMYAPFGALFVWHLYFVHRRVIDRDATAMPWMLLITLLAIFTSEFAIFLALLNLIPPLLERGRQAVLGLIGPVAVIVSVYLWQTYGFRYLGVDDALPEAVVSGASGGEAETGSGGIGISLPVHLPPILLPRIFGDIAWLAGFVLPLGFLAAAAFAWIRRNQQSAIQTVGSLGIAVPIMVISLAALNQFSLAFWVTVVAALLSGTRPEAWIAATLTRPVLLSLLSLVTSLLFWIAYLATHDGAAESLLSFKTGEHVKDSVLLLFNYPNLWRDVVVPLREAMPLQAALMAVAIGLGAWLAGRRPEGDALARGYWLVAGLLLVTLLLVPVFTKPYYTLRYSYFAYSTALILTAVALTMAGEAFFRKPVARIAAAVTLALTFAVVAEDFDAQHLADIDSERVTFRIGYSAGKVDQYYKRWDYRAPAAYVNAERRADELVIASDYSVPYYLEHMDYLYIDRDDGRFEIISRRRGTIDVWEGAPLLYSADQVLAVLRDSPQAVWLIARSDKYGFQNPAEHLATERFDDFRVFRSVDGYLDVYRIPPGSAASAP